MNRTVSTPGTSPQSRSTHGGPAVRKSLEEYGRGVAGGLLFSLPLLYTMEVWWAGFVAHPFRLLLYVLATFALLLAYNRYAGLREDSSFFEILIDSVEEMGIGLLLATLILWLLNRIHLEMPPGELLGKIIIEAMTVAIGVSVGTAQLGGDESNEGLSGNQQSSNDESKKPDENDQPEGRDKREEPDFIEQTVIALCGAILIAANIGPTEEIVMLAVETPPAKLLAMAVFSLTLCVVVLHYSGFRGAKQFTGGGVVDIVRGSIVTYAVALLASAVLCWFFGRFDGASPGIMVALTVTLAFPATLGASAGRLLLQSNSQ